MTQYNPSLLLKRLYVAKSGRAAYDETFHRGVNMIRSDGNSRGKSTIADLIFFALGGDLTSWKDEAASCDYTLAELSINGSEVVLKREIDSHASRIPMWIYFGTFESAQESPIEGWQRYGYSRSGDRESFSQILFRCLGIQDVSTEESNITFYQILRLLYVDQMTPVNRIFRFDHNDSPLRRQAVGDLLCGVLDDRIYPSQIKLREQEKEYSLKNLQLTSLLNILRQVDEDVDFSDLFDKVKATEIERANILNEIDIIKKSTDPELKISEHDSNVLDRLNHDLLSMGATINTTQDDLNRATYAIEDAKLLLDDIENSLKQLQQAQITGETLGSLTFSFCPSCFNSIDAITATHSCHLCKQDVDPDQERSRYARIRNELQIQYKESSALQETRVSKHSELEGRLSKLLRMRELMSSEYHSITRNFTTNSQAEIESLTKKVGYLDRQLIDYDREKRISNEINNLREAKSQLNENISYLRSEIQDWVANKQKRQASAYYLISDAVARILEKDTESDIDSVSATGVSFNFTEDRIEVNGKSSYSASSLTVIRNSFHLGMLAASCVDRKFSYPRFLLLDNIEDKGMTPDRSKNFQKIILDVSQSLGVDHQIIFTTSMPNDLLESPSISVGEKYTDHNKSLKV